MTNKLDTLAQARIDLWNGMKDKGIDCPCCGRFAKLYRYQISTAQICAFQWIVQNWAVKPQLNDYVDVQSTAPKWLLRSNSHGKLVHWGLLETKPCDDSSKKHGGLWRPTDFGVAFWSGRASILEYAYVFNNQCKGHDGERKYFYNIYSRFDYAKLMASTAEGVSDESLNANAG